MTAEPAELHKVAIRSLKCGHPSCGIRYPSPPDDERFGRCPRCGSTVREVGRYRSFDLARTREVSPAPSDQGRAPWANSSDRRRVVAVLDNIRSSLNVGTILRSADGIALDHVYHCGITPPASHPKVRKTSLGAERTVDSSHHLDGVECVRRLIDGGFAIWVLEASPTSVEITELETAPARIALVVGNEVAGVDPAILDLADIHVRLAMRGTKTSLNVAVAFGIGSYWLRSLPLPAPR